MEVKELRKLTGLSQSKFAKKYHIDIWTLRNWEQEKCKPTESLLYLLERAVKYDLQQSEVK